MADFEKKVSLIEIEVDNSAAMAEVDRLTTSILNQKKQVQDNNEAIKAYNQANKDAAKALKEGVISLEDYTHVTEQNTKAVQNLQKQNLALGDGLKDLNSERANAVKVSKLQSNSLDALRKQTADMKKELNGLNTSTEAGAQRFKELTDKLKDNNDAIVRLDQNAGDFKTTIGRYKEEVGAALESSDAFTGGLGGMAKGFVANAKAALAFLATPIGAVLGAVAAVFLLVKNAMDRNEESGNKVRRLFSALSGVFNMVLKALEPLGEFIINYIVGYFETLGKIAEWSLGMVSKGLAALGFDEAAKSVDNFTASTKASIAAAQEMADMEAELQKRMRETEKIMLDYQKREEKLRQLRDDDTLSIKERIAANDQLGQVLQEQMSKELEIANLALKVAERRIELEGETSENLDARAEALTKIADINERITGQESEQLANRNALLKEANDAEKAAFEEREAMRKEEADKKKATSDKELEEKKAAAEKEAEIQKALDEERIKNLETLSVKMLALEEFRRSQANEIRINENKDILDQLKAREEIEAENFAIMQARIAEEKAEVQENDAATKEEKLIAEQEYLLQIENLEAQHSENLKAIAEARAAELARIEKEKQDKLRVYADAGNQAIAGGFKIANNLITGYYSERYANIQKQLEGGQITEEQYARKKANLDKNQAKDLYKAQLAQFRVEKAISLTTAIVKTAQSVASAIAASPLTGGLPFSAINAALGGVQIATIATEKAPPPPSFEFGGDVFGVIAGGKDHAQGGTKYRGDDGNIIEVERGEGLFVTKREATNPALRLLSEQNVLAGGRSMFGQTSRYLENGGGVNLNPQQDLSILAEAIQNMPAPKIELESIMAGIGEVNRSRQVGIV